MDQESPGGVPGFAVMLALLMGCASASGAAASGERTFLDAFVAERPVYDVDAPRAAGNRAIVLLHFGRREEAVAELLAHYREVGTTPNPALGAYSIGLAAHLLKQDLSGEDLKALRRRLNAVAAGLGQPGSRTVCDTEAERNAWQAALLALVANLYGSGDDTGARFTASTP